MHYNDAKIIENSHDHSLKIKEIYHWDKITCDACSLEKIIISPLPAKIDKE